MRWNKAPKQMGGSGPTTRRCEMKRRLRPAYPMFLLAIAMLSMAATIGVLWLFGGEQGGSAQPGDAEGPGGRWLTIERDRLTVCVETANVAVDTRTAARSEVEDILTDLAGDPLWPEFNKGFPPPLVDEGCPSPPILYDPNAHRPRPFPDMFVFLNGRQVSDASYYYLHVYVIPQDDIDRYGAGVDSRFTSEEIFCHYDSCTQATGGLYVSTKDLDDRQLLTDLIAKAIGLRRTGN